MFFILLAVSSHCTGMFLKCTTSLYKVTKLTRREINKKNWNIFIEGYNFLWGHFFIRVKLHFFNTVFKYTFRPNLNFFYSDLWRVVCRNFETVKQKLGEKARLRSAVLYIRDFDSYPSSRSRCDQKWTRTLDNNIICSRYLQYLSVIEGTAPVIVLQRFDSPNLSPLYLRYTALYTCPSDRVGGKRLGESNLCKTMEGAVPSTRSTILPLLFNKFSVQRIKKQDKTLCTVL